MSELNTLSPAPVYYVPVAVSSPTRIAKTLLMMPLVGHALLGIFYVFVLLYAIGSLYGAERSNTIAGSLFLIIWCAGHVWLFVIAYRSILALRRECLEAKLEAKS